LLASFFPTRVKHNIAKREREEKERRLVVRNQFLLGSTELLGVIDLDVRHLDDEVDGKEEEEEML
jgi:hypothetical protein